MMPWLELLGRMLLVATGLLLPGAGWALAGRWPLPWFAAGVLSALAALAGVMVFAIIGVPITAVTLGGWLGGVTLAGGIHWWTRRSPVIAAPRAGGTEWWLALPALPLVIVALYRATAQPLSGADVDFRWNYLATLIVEHGHLDYYPAASATAFAQYFWPDGIVPLVSSVYAWTYLAAGETARIWTALPVLLQFSALLALLHGLGKTWGGDRAGWLACALGGATMLLQFAFGLGQETGLTALGAGGMVFYLWHWQESRRASLLLPAAACAALAVCAREYGALFFLVGVGWVARRGGWRQTIIFALGAAVLPAAWHLRNWVFTGNPLYAHDLAGFFPVNPVFHVWMQGYVETHGRALRELAGWREIARLLCLSALPALFGLAAGIILWRKQPGRAVGLAVGLATTAAWLSSVPFTAGGLFYSMRVLSPLLVIGCAWGGAALARWVPGRRHLAGLLLGLGLFGTDAALRAWTIPVNPYTIPPQEWPVAGYQLQRDFDRNDLPFITAVAGQVTGRVLSESAGVQRVFHARGRELVPLWSPEVAFLFDPKFRGDAVTRLRALGFTHLLLTRVQSSVDFLARTGALPRLTGRIHSVMANDTFVLFALDAARAEPAPP